VLACRFLPNTEAPRSPVPGPAFGKVSQDG
jgi:hypothetical protein